MTPEQAQQMDDLYYAEVQSDLWYRTAKNEKDREEFKSMRDLARRKISNITGEPFNG